MNEAFITPIQLIGNISDISETGRAPRVQASGNSIFRDVFQNAINDVTTTDRDYADKQYLLATGQIDDVHTVPIAAAKAQASVDLLVQLRNKALETYNELMRVNV